MKHFLHWDVRPWRHTIATALCSIFMLATAWGQLPQYNANDITPPSSNSGKLTGAANGKQVGGGGNGHAMLLNGNALTSIDLHPAGYSYSMATSTDGTEHCGYAYGFGIHAMAQR